MKKKADRPAEHKSLVPDSFWLAGIRWTVKREVNMPGELGCCIRDEATIKIRANLPTQVEEHTFCHELVHAIKFTMGIDGEKHDETEVDAVGALIHQYLITRSD